MHVSIRKARYQDADRISQILRDNWRHSFRGVYSKKRIKRSVARWSSNGVLKLFKNYKPHFVAVYDGEVCGYVGYEKKKNKVKIWALYVDIHKQGKGIGARLLRFVERKTKASSYVLTSTSRRVTLKFYEKVGYSKVRTVKPKLGILMLLW